MVFIMQRCIMNNNINISNFETNGPAAQYFKYL